MFTNFLKVTLRTLYHEKKYAAINIVGLSVAISCCLIIGLYLFSELTYDQHNKQHKKIYRVVNELNVNGKQELFARTSPVLGEMLKEEYAEVEDCVWFWVLSDMKLQIISEGKSLYWDNVAFVSNNIFKYFDHEIIYGDPDNLEGESAAVSETFARMYYGDENPIGKVIESEGHKIKISIVFADLPENSHLKYHCINLNNEAVNTLPDNEAIRSQMLWNIRNYTYLIMAEDYDISKFKDISESFYDSHMAEMGKSLNASWKAWLQPLADIHYDADAHLDLDEPTGNIIYIYGFEAVAIFLLIVACINYTNLATARAASRAKEVGMRKVLGSGRKSLIFQFLGESVLFSIIAMLFGFVLVELILKYTPINELLDKQLTLSLLNNPELIVGLFAFCLALGLMSGIYPAFYLSSMLPLTTLVGKHQTGKGSIRLRKILVLVQFTISVCVIGCTLIMALQMKFVSNKSLGFNKENRLLVTLRTGDVIEKVPTIKKELLKNSSILGVSMSSNVIGKTPNIVGADIADNNDISNMTTMNMFQVSEDYINVMGMELARGRDFSRRLLTDLGDSYVVNEAMVKKMGWDEPLGKKIAAGGSPGKVIGVVKDFHYASLHKKIEPFALMRLPAVPKDYEARRRMIYYLILNIKGDDISSTLDFLENKFAEFDPKHPFEYEFLDDSLNELYFSEQRLMKFIGIFAVVCIFISCLGLFGLSAFTTEQRKKEIGIRKVLGASTWKIIIMLASNILLLVTGGAVVASLITYFAMDEWLTDFAYRININKDVWVFFVSAAIASCVAFATVAMQSFKTAQENPVKALRYE